jgi:NADH-quinone oxidoreductase subunit C
MNEEKPTDPKQSPPAAVPDAAKPIAGAPPVAAAAPATPAAAPATPAVPAAPAPPAEPGKFEKFLKTQGISSTRLPESSGVETIELAPADIRKAVVSLRDDKSTCLNFLVAVSGVDSPETYDSVYHLRSYFNHDELVIKLRIPKSSVAEGKLPAVPSIAPQWEAADWHERETYDLVGIRYLGHPYPRRILNPWDWEGHPLRRDYKQPVDALNDKSPESFR